jgi:hypothetical protein
MMLNQVRKKMNVRLVLIVALLNNLCMQSMDQEEPSVAEMVLTLLARDNFNRFSEKERSAFGIFPLDISSGERLHEAESCITSMPNSINSLLDHKGGSCVVQSPDKTYTIIGLSSGAFAVCGNGIYKETQFGKSAAAELRNVPITAFARGPGEWDLTDYKNPKISLVVGYQNGMVLFYDSKDDHGHHASRLKDVEPILHIAPGALPGTWLFVTARYIYLDKCEDDEGIFKVGDRPAKRISIASLGTLQGIGTMMGTLLLKTGATAFYRIVPYSAEETQQLFIDRSPEMLKKYYDAYYAQKAAQIQELQSAFAALEIKALKLKAASITT